MVVARAFALFALMLVFGACSGSDAGRDDGAVPMYRGEPNGDDAALVGRLEFNATGCLVITDDAGGTQWFAAHAGSSSWDADDEVLTIGGRALKIGEQVVLGGSAMPTSRALMQLDWETKPRPECSDAHQQIWIAGDSAQFRQDSAFRE